MLQTCAHSHEHMRKLIQTDVRTHQICKQPRASIETVDQPMQGRIKEWATSPAYDDQNSNHIEDEETSPGQPVYLFQYAGKC